MVIFSSTLVIKIFTVVVSQNYYSHGTAIFTIDIFSIVQLGKTPPTVK